MGSVRCPSMWILKSNSRATPVLFEKVDQNNPLQLSQAEQSCSLLLWMNLWPGWFPSAVSATATLDMCPDCPTAEDLHNPDVKNTANLSLKKFNKESSQANYFRLENVTRASSQVKLGHLTCFWWRFMRFFYFDYVSWCVCQWVVGPAYFVEFTIVETGCLKKTDPGETKDCPPMDCRFTVS